MTSSTINRWVPVSILVVSLIGFVDATYLTVQHLRDADVGCSVIYGCEQVLTSVYAEVAGIPTALFGALFYLAILVCTIAYLDTRRAGWLRVVAWLALPGFLVTLVLLYLQAFVIQYWCQFCLVSALTSTILFGIGVWLLRSWKVHQSPSSMRLVVATGNVGKMQEIKKILSGLPLQVVSAQEAGVAGHAIEDGDTLEANALKKARFVSRQVHDWVVADDTGLFIDGLRGEPGVRSARYAGADASDQALQDAILTATRALPDDQRTAHFTSVIALVSPAGEEHLYRGTLSGMITRQVEGTPRPQLPYDQIFQPNGSTGTFAALSDDAKNQMSHRRKAFDQLREYLTETVRASQSKNSAR